MHAIWVQSRISRNTREDIQRIGWNYPDILQQLEASLFEYEDFEERFLEADPDTGTQVALPEAFLCAISDE